MAAHCLLNFVVLHIVHCMKIWNALHSVNWPYSSLLSFLLMMSLVTEFVSTLVTVVEKQCRSLGKQQIGIQILGILHNLIFVKETSGKDMDLPVLGTFHGWSLDDD